ncbi:hypothetical protein G6F22_016376 [Rhizopus arrhizus]|nr:hypothetical protein G6F22_016376 [Rhizopus arrhizus]
MKPARGRLPENGREIVETALGGQQATVIDLAQPLDSIVRAEHGDQAARPGQVALALADTEPVSLVGVEVDPRVLGQAGGQGQQQRIHGGLVARLDHRPQLVQGNHRRLAEWFDPEPAQRADMRAAAQAFTEVTGQAADAAAPAPRWRAPAPRARAPR